MAKGADQPSAGFSSSVLRYPDVVAVLVGAGLAVVYGAPELGCALGAGGWILTRVISALDARWVGKMADPVKQLATNLFEAFARIWLLAGVIVLASWVGERRDGLAAAVTIFGAYSVAFVSRLFYGAMRSRAAK